MFGWFSRRGGAVGAHAEPVARQWGQHEPVPVPEPNPESRLVSYHGASGPPFEPREKQEKRSSEPSGSQWPSGPMKRHQRPETAATQYVQWLLREGYSGEYRWIDLWRTYRLDYCKQVNEQPVANNYQHLFAQQLGRLCQRDYYRVVVNG